MSTGTFLATIQPIEEKQHEEDKYRLAAIVESSDDAIIGKDLNGIVTTWNFSAERIFGYTSDEIIGRPISLLIPPELQDDEVVIIGKIRSGERINHFETERLRKNGERFSVSLTISPVKDRNGKIIGAAKILRDITQQKKLESSLRTTERLASVGRLAATVAHEINNPLEAVINLIYLATQQPEISEVTKMYLSSADQELARVAHIAQQTLGFYRDSSEPAQLLVSKVVDEVLMIYERRCRGRNLTIIRRIDPGLRLCVVQGELKQILSNLIANAIDASQEGGRVIIAARSSRHLSSGIAGVRLTIADNGSGIRNIDKQKLFAPFFTSGKPVGTGLGLWITKDLVTKMQGDIRFRSRTADPHGTIMRIFLPLAPASHKLSQQEPLQKTA